MCFGRLTHGNICRMSMMGGVHGRPEVPLTRCSPTNGAQGSELDGIPLFWLRVCPSAIRRLGFGRCSLFLRQALDTTPTFEVPTRSASSRRDLLKICTKAGTRNTECRRVPSPVRRFAGDQLRTGHGRHPHHRHHADPLELPTRNKPKAMRATISPR